MYGCRWIRQGVCSQGSDTWWFQVKHTTQIACLLWGISADSHHMVKTYSMVLLLCFPCQLSREFCLNLGCLLEIWSISVHFCIPWGSQITCSPQILLCANHTMSFLMIATQGQRKCPHCPIILASNAHTFGSTTDNLVEPLKKTSNPAGGHKLPR